MDEPLFSINGAEDDEDEEIDAEYDGDFTVFYSDEMAHEHEALVTASVDFIAQYQGVTSAMHSDREVISVWGADVDRAALGADLEEFLRSRLP